MRRKLVSALLALALSSLVPAGCGGPAPDALDDAQASALAPALADDADAPGLSFPQRVDRALARHDAGRYVEAVEELRLLAPRSPIVRALLARSLVEAGHLAEAYDEAVRATREGPDASATWFFLAMAAERDGRAEEAREALLTCLDLDPASAAAWNNLGTLDYQRVDFHRARQHTERALSLATDDHGRSIAEANLGELDALAGRASDAEAHLDRALELAPDAAHAYFALGALYDVTGRPEASRRMMELGVSLDLLGATRRSLSFVWPELQLHHDALVAEARGDQALARRHWSALQAIETGSGLRHGPLAGRAAAHLAQLVALAPVITGAGGTDDEGADAPSEPAFTISDELVRDTIVLQGATSAVQEKQDAVAETLELYVGYAEFEANLPQPPHKCD
jgi:Flp pilus assembly protein TadD